MKNIQSQQGFTMVELLIYLAIVGLVAAAIVQVIISINSASSANHGAQSVNSNMRAAVEVMTAEIKAAQGLVVGSSTLGSDPGVLWLVPLTSSTDPVVFDLDQDNGRLRLTYGSADPVYVVSDDVRVTDLQFEHQTALNGNDAIQITMTIAEKLQSGTEQVYSLSVTSTATMRN